MNNQITIDCVDVSECEFYYHGFCALQNKIRETLPSVKTCSKNEFCICKQLKRKEQECEKLINKNNILETELNQIKLLLEGKNTQYSQLKTENEELKEKFKKFFNIDNQECWNIAFLNDEKERYKQAFDEIEEYLKTQLDDFGNAVYSVDKSAIIKISNIINKAKEQ